MLFLLDSLVALPASRFDMDTHFVVTVQSGFCGAGLDHVRVGELSSDSKSDLEHHSTALVSAPETAGRSGAVEVACAI